MSEKLVTIEPEEFKQMLDAGEVTFVFDLREKDEFEAWRIEGRTPVEILNIPEEDFAEDEEASLARVPKDREVITVCADGDCSRRSAELLREKGFQARGLDGGMNQWTEFYETRKVNTDPDVYQIFRVAKGCITHVIVSGGKAVVIDPVRHIEHIEKVLNDTGAKLVHVFDTHLQSDHVSGGRELALRHNAHYHINSADAIDALFHHASLRNGEEFRIGFSSLVAAIQTPGHTAGSTSLILDGKFIFSGNAIMPSAVGRPTFRGMASLWADLLFCTLHERFDPLPDEMVILPSHAAGIHEQDEEGVVRLTLGEARRRLPLMSILDRKKFVQAVEATLPENPERYTFIRKVNLGVLDADEQRLRELEQGKNLCGIPEALMDRGPSTGNPVSRVSSAIEATDDDLVESSVAETSDMRPLEVEDVKEDSEEASGNGGNGSKPTAEPMDTVLDTSEEQSDLDVMESETEEEPVLLESSKQEELEVAETEVAASNIRTVADQPGTAIEDSETVFVVEPAYQEPQPEQARPQAIHQPLPRRDMPSAKEVDAALPESKEMGEIIEKLAEERFDKMMSDIDLKSMLVDALTPTIKDSMARVLWEATPQMTEVLLKHALQKSLGTLDKKLESVIWGTVPELAEALIRKEIKKIHGKS